MDEKKRNTFIADVTNIHLDIHVYIIADNVL